MPVPIANPPDGHAARWRSRLRWAEPSGEVCLGHSGGLPFGAARRSAREPILCDTLHVSEIEVDVSSRLDLQLDTLSQAVAASTGGVVGLRRAGHADPGASDWLALVQQVPLIGSLMQSMVVIVKGVGMNLANVSAVPFRFDALHVEHPACAPSELVYSFGQQISWQAAAQLGKLLGHSDLLGNPLGLISSVGTGMVGFVRGVGVGIARGDGDEIVRSGRNLLGHVVGGFAGAGARLTGTLHSVLEQLSAKTVIRPVAFDLRRGGDLKDGVMLGGRGALKTLHRGFQDLLQRPVQGARLGTLGLAQGVADGMWGFALSPVVATLEAGTLVLSSVEQVLTDPHAPRALVRPARSFFSSPQMLPLARCMMSSLQVSVLDLRCTTVERGAVHVEARPERLEPIARGDAACARARTHPQPPGRPLPPRANSRLSVSPPPSAGSYRCTSRPSPPRASGERRRVALGCRASTGGAATTLTSGSSRWGRLTPGLCCASTTARSRCS